MKIYLLKPNLTLSTVVPAPEADKHAVVRTVAP